MPSVLWHAFLLSLWYFVADAKFLHLVHPSSGDNVIIAPLSQDRLAIRARQAATLHMRGFHYTMGDMNRPVTLVWPEEQDRCGEYSSLQKHGSHVIDTYWNSAGEMEITFLLDKPYIEGVVLCFGEFALGPWVEIHPPQPSEVFFHPIMPRRNQWLTFAFVGENLISAAMAQAAALISTEDVSNQYDHGKIVDMTRLCVDDSEPLAVLNISEGTESQTYATTVLPFLGHYRICYKQYQHPWTWVGNVQFFMDQSNPSSYQNDGQIDVGAKEVFLIYGEQLNPNGEGSAKDAYKIINSTQECNIDAPPSPMVKETSPLEQVEDDQVSTFSVVFYAPGFYTLCYFVAAEGTWTKMEPPITAPPSNPISYAIQPGLSYNLGGVDLVLTARTIKLAFDGFYIDNAVIVLINATRSCLKSQEWAFTHRGKLVDTIHGEAGRMIATYEFDLGLSPTGDYAVCYGETLPYPVAGPPLRVVALPAITALASTRCQTASDDISVIDCSTFEWDKPLTIYGSNFGQSGSSVMINRVPCEYTYHEPGYETSILICAGWNGTGMANEVRVKSDMLLSPITAATVSFSPVPMVHSVSGCYDASLETYDCPRNQTDYRLTIQGQNFGQFGASVQIGDAFCPTVEHVEGKMDSMLICQGFYSDNEDPNAFSVPIRVTTKMGESSLLNATISYAGLPIVTGVTGCVDDDIRDPRYNKHTGKCPTEGKMAVTVYGHQFGTLFPSGLSFGDLPCLLPYRQDTNDTDAIVCVLYPGSGDQLPVRVFNRLDSNRNNDILLSFRPVPAIKRVSGCTPSGPSAIDCPLGPSGTVPLTIYGERFGIPPMPISVEIGDSQCQEIVGHTQDKLICKSLPYNPSSPQRMPVVIFVDGERSWPNPNVYVSYSGFCPGLVETATGFYNCSGHGKCLESGSCQCHSDPYNGFWSASDCSQCAPGWAGLECKQACGGGACYPCSQAGICNDGVNGDATCTCFANISVGYYTGEICDQCLDGWYGLKCKSRCPVDSQDRVCSTHGTCDDDRTGTGHCTCFIMDIRVFATLDQGSWQGTACDECIPGFYGPECVLRCPTNDNGMPCGGHGTCQDGTAGTGLCVCDVGWVGDDCFTPCEGLITSGEGGLVPCSGHGMCDTEVDIGSCVCDEFYGSSTCAVYCDPEVTCNGRGTCDNITHLCNCFEPLAGENCDRCKLGYYGPVTGCVSECLPNISAPCNHHGVCEGDNWGNPTCICNTEWYGPTCANRCPGRPEGVACSGHGTCLSGNKGSGACMCFTGEEQGYWTGADCSRCQEGYWGPNCRNLCAGILQTSSREVCYNNGKCIEGYSGTGQCQCTDPDWGPECSCLTSRDQAICSPQNRCSDNFYGPGCAFPCSCSGHGYCTRMTEGPACVCDLGWGAEFCNEQCPGVIDSMGNFLICGEAGYCNTTLDKPECTCFDNFAGKNCAIRCPVSANQEICCGHGTCLQGSSNDGTCQCDPNWAGAECCISCPVDAESIICSGHGQCRDGSNETGVCDCMPDWNGTRCDECRDQKAGWDCTLFCPRWDGEKCGSHGICNDGRKGDAKCICAPGYAGELCDIECLGGGDTPCSGHGQCDLLDGSCTCDLHYYSETCSVYCCVESEDLPCNATDALGVLLDPTCLEYEHPICEANTGNCICQEDLLLGMWTGEKCDECVSGFWGEFCSIVCKCNISPCNRASGDCENCIDDPILGHWAGQYCSDCALGFVGSQCTEKIARMSRADSLTLELLDEDSPAEGYPTGKFVYDPSEDVLVVGGRRVLKAAANREQYSEPVYLDEILGTVAVMETIHFIVYFGVRDTSQGYQKDRIYRFNTHAGLNQDNALINNMLFLNTIANTLQDAVFDHARMIGYFFSFDPNLPSLTPIVTVVFCPGYPLAGGALPAMRRLKEIIIDLRYMKPIPQATKIIWDTNLEQPVIFFSQEGKILWITLSRFDNSFDNSTSNIPAPKPLPEIFLDNDMPTLGRKFQTQAHEISAFQQQQAHRRKLGKPTGLRNPYPYRQVNLSSLPKLETEPVQKELEKRIKFKAQSTQWYTQPVPLEVKECVGKADMAFECIGIAGMVQSDDGNTFYIVIETTQQDFSAVVAKFEVDRLELKYILSQPIPYKSLIPHSFCAMTLDTATNDLYIGLGKGKPSTLFSLSDQTLRIKASVTLSNVIVNGIKFPEEIVDMQIDLDNRLLYCLLSPPGGRIVTYNLYGVFNVTPNYADYTGGTIITVTGFGPGFKNLGGTECKFGSDIINGVTKGTYVNPTTILCIAPNKTDELSPCNGEPLEVSLKDQRWTDNLVPVRHVTTPLITCADQAECLVPSRSLMTGQSTIAVHGLGFIDSPFISCLFADPENPDLPDNTPFKVIVPATFVDSFLIKCDAPPRPAELGPSIPGSVLKVSLDGQIFNKEFTSFDYIDVAHGITNTFKQEVETIQPTIAAEITNAGTIVVYVYDSQNHRVLDFDHPNQRTITVTANCTPLDPNRKTPPILGTTSHVTENGFAVFDDLSFEVPPVADYYFTFTELENGWTHLVKLAITAGHPRSLAFKSQPPNSTDGEGRVFPFTVVVNDVAGNTVDGVQLGLVVELYKGWTDEEALEVGASSADRASITQETQKTLNVAGEAEFTKVTLLNTRHTGKYRVILSAKGRTQVSNITVDLESGRCPVGQYGLAGTFLKECIACPVPCGECDGSVVVKAKVGCWRAYATSVEMFQCNNEEACKGGNEEGDAQCTEKYRAPLCQQCKEGYGATVADRICEECPPLATQVISVLLLVLLAVVILYVMKNSSSRDAAREQVAVAFKSAVPKTKMSAIFKLLLNHMQLIAIAKDYRLEWPVSMVGIFEALDRISSLQIDSVAVNCMLGSDFYKKYVVIITFPIIMLACTMAFYGMLHFWWDRTFKSNKPRDRWGNMILTNLVVIFLTYPTMLKRSSHMFKCMDISGKYYINRDTSVECYTPQHQGWMVVAGLSGMMYGVGVPVLGFLYLYGFAKKNRLLDAYVFTKFAFLYRGYKTSGGRGDFERWYWEMVIQIRKLLLTVATVLFYQEPYIQAFAGLWVCVVAFFVSLVYQPYENSRLQLLEEASLATTVFTFVVGLLHEEMIEDSATDAIRETLVFILLAVNILCLVLFAWILWKEWIQMVKSSDRTLKLHNIIYQTNAETLAIKREEYLVKMGLKDKAYDKEDEEFLQQMETIVSKVKGGKMSHDDKGSMQKLLHVMTLWGIVDEDDVKALQKKDEKDADRKKKLKLRWMKVIKKVIKTNILGLGETTSEPPPPPPPEPPKDTAKQRWKRALKNPQLKRLGAEEPEEPEETEKAKDDWLATPVKDTAKQRWQNALKNPKLSTLGKNPMEDLKQTDVEEDSESEGEDVEPGKIVPLAETAHLNASNPELVRQWLGEVATPREPEDFNLAKTTSSPRSLGASLKANSSAYKFPTRSKVSPRTGESSKNRASAYAYPTKAPMTLQDLEDSVFVDPATAKAPVSGPTENLATSLKDQGYKYAVESVSGASGSGSGSLVSSRSHDVKK